MIAAIYRIARSDSPTERRLGWGSATAKTSTVPEQTRTAVTNDRARRGPQDNGLTAAPCLRTPPAEVTAAVAQADAQIAELKRLVREGALTAAVAAPALATAHKQRQTALRPASRRTARTSESLDFRVEEAFRETIAHMGRVLRGDNLIEARGVAPPDCRNRPAAPGRGSSDSEVRTRGNSATYSSEW